LLLAWVIGHVDHQGQLTLKPRRIGRLTESSLSRWRAHQPVAIGTHRSWSNGASRPSPA
jgi:hypothetical protein